MGGAPEQHAIHADPVGADDVVGDGVANIDRFVCLNGGEGKGVVKDLGMRLASANRIRGGEGIGTREQTQVLSFGALAVGVGVGGAVGEDADVPAWT